MDDLTSSMRAFVKSEEWDVLKGIAIKQIESLQRKALEPASSDFDLVVRDRYAFAAQQLEMYFLVVEREFTKEPKEEPDELT